MVFAHGLLFFEPFDGMGNLHTGVWEKIPGDHHACADRTDQESYCLKESAHNRVSAQVYSNAHKQSDDTAKEILPGSFFRSSKMPSSSSIFDGPSTCFAISTAAYLLPLSSKHSQTKTDTGIMNPVKTPRTGIKSDIVGLAVTIAVTRAFADLTSNS